MQMKKGGGDETRHGSVQHEPCKPIDILAKDMYGDETMGDGEEAKIYKRGEKRRAHTQLQDARVLQCVLEDGFLDGGKHETNL